jgi:lipoprotein-anchoring transpeptidase ErfK/SrfK
MVAATRGRLAIPPHEVMGQAASELRLARAADGETAAPATLALAWDAYAFGLLLMRREEGRVEWRRDYTESAEHFQSAITIARTAAEVSGRRRVRAATSGRRSLREAGDALRPLAGVEDVVWVPREDRRRLQIARNLFSSASELSDRGAHAASIERAAEAVRMAEAVREALLEVTSRFRDPDHLRTWRAWIDETVRWSRETGRVAVVVLKDDHQVVVYERGRVRARWTGELGWNNVGDKRSRGDGATPEGRYFITQKKGAGASRYHKALLIDYPNKEDLRALASASAGRSTRLDPGGLIEIHGEGGKGRDWTDGCVALTNPEVDELFALVSVGTPVTIVGSQSGSGLFSDVARRLAR